MAWKMGLAILLNIMGDENIYLSSFMVGKSRMRQNNLKSNLRFPFSGLKPTLHVIVRE